MVLAVFPPLPAVTESGSPLTVARPSRIFAGFLTHERYVIGVGAAARNSSRALNGFRGALRGNMVQGASSSLFAFEALALLLTTLLGAWIGVAHPKPAGTFWILPGALSPVASIAL